MEIVSVRRTASIARYHYAIRDQAKSRPLNPSENRKAEVEITFRVFQRREELIDVVRQRVPISIRIGGKACRRFVFTVRIARRPRTAVRRRLLAQ
jgi:hypothetical protein